MGGSGREGGAAAASSSQQWRHRHSGTQCGTHAHTVTQVGADYNVREPWQWCMAFVIPPPCSGLMSHNWSDVSGPTFEGKYGKCRFRHSDLILNETILHFLAICQWNWGGGKLNALCEIPSCPKLGNWCKVKCFTTWKKTLKWGFAQCIFI